MQRERWMYKLYELSRGFGFRVDTLKNIVLQDATFCSLGQVTNLNRNIGYLMTKRLLFHAYLTVVSVTDNQYIFFFFCGAAAQRGPWPPHS